MSKKLFVLFFFTLLVVTALFYFLVIFPSSFKLSSVTDSLNNEYKPIISNNVINRTNSLSKLNTKLFKKYNINVEVKPMENTHVLFAYFSTVNTENMENLTSVDASVDTQNKTIRVTIYINTKYPFSQNEVQTEVNQFLITGLLYAQSQLEKKQMTPELRTQIYSDSRLIYEEMLKTNKIWIIYE